MIKSTYNFNERPYVEDSIPQVNPLTPEELQSLQDKNEANRTEKKIIEIVQHSKKLNTLRTIMRITGFLVAASTGAALASGNILGLPIFMVFLLLVSSERIIETNTTRKVNVLSGELLDCTTPASVPSFMKQIHNSSEPVYSIVRRALTHHLPEWLNSPSRPAYPLSTSIIVNCLSNQTANEFPKLACILLDSVDAGQSLELLPVITLFLVRPSNLQARREILTAARSAYQRLITGIEADSVSDTKLASWFKALNQDNDVHTYIGNTERSPYNRDWKTYIIAREEFTRLHSLVAEEQVKKISTDQRSKLYASIVELQESFNDRRHQLDLLGDAFALAIIAFARNTRDIIASDPFRKIQEIENISNDVKLSALECANFLDHVRTHEIGMQTLLRSSDHTTNSTELLRVSTSNTDELTLLKIRENNL